MDRSNNYNRIRNYFKNLSEKSTLLKDFAGFLDRELRNKTNSFTGISSPFLHLWKYQKGYLGENQQTMAVISVGYAILKNNISVTDFEAIYDAVDECEKIAHHVNSRIRYDSNDPNHFLFNSYLKDRTRIEPIYMEEVGFGVEVQVFFQNPQPIKLNPDEWTDIESVC